MLILGIDTSCDETAAGVVKDGRTVLSNVVSSQADVHRKYGGVVPELACRRHLEVINFVIDEALSQAHCSFKDLDGIAVTVGPGLAPALVIGVTTAKAIAYASHLPVVGVNHIEAHIFANFLRPIAGESSSGELKPPFIALVVSGGHSDLVYVENYGKYQLLAKTRDDAVGESFDKVANLLQLGYPGGPVIDKLAKEGNPHAIRFPLARMKDRSIDFSFSGLKTAVVNLVRKEKERFSVSDIAASFQHSAVEALLENTSLALRERNLRCLVLGGGVASNSYLREKFQVRAQQENWQIYYPEPELCTDNGAMVGCVGYFKMKHSVREPFASLTVKPNLQIESWS